MSRYSPMTTEEIREKLRGIRCFVLDMDGTIYLENGDSRTAYQWTAER